VEPCCTGLYRTGEVVRLTATPSPSWVFTSWRGNAGTGQSTNRVLDVVMDQDKNIIARFDVRPPNPDDLKAIVPAEGAETAEGQTESTGQ
jgi:List-Bact-rpt repeat protein